jgi:hypothetical protein
MGNSFTKPPYNSPKNASPLFHDFLQIGEMQDSLILARPEEESESRTLQKISVPSWKLGLSLLVAPINSSDDRVACESPLMSTV